MPRREPTMLVSTCEIGCEHMRTHRFLHNLMEWSAAFTDSEVGL